jgi:hypothetical protein
VAQLERKLGMSAALRQAASLTASDAPAMSFDDQLRVFAIEYPGGFQDPAWIRNKRGEGERRRLKRHRDGAIREAQRSLSPSRITELLREERFGEILDDAVAVLDSTDLVTRKQVQLIARLGPLPERALAGALGDLLYGHEPYELRFERFVASLALSRDGAPSWQLATALPALVRPSEQVCVRPVPMRKQALSMAPDVVYTSTPNATVYLQFAEMVGRVGEELEAARLSPRDFLDVHDFIAETLRPSAKRLLEH